MDFLREDYRHLPRGRAESDIQSAGRMGHEVLCPFTIGELRTIPGTNIQVRITSLDCHRLQDTTEEQAIAEGIDSTRGVEDDGSGWLEVGVRYWKPINREFANYSTPAKAFRGLWHDLCPSGPKSWDANPMTWVVGFEYAGEVSDE
jgi:hypothetical protein